METTFLATCTAGWQREARRRLRQVFPGATVERLCMSGTLLATVPLPRAEALMSVARSETSVLSRLVPVVGEPAEAALSRATEGLRVRRLPHNRREVTVVTKRGPANFSLDSSRQHDYPYYVTRDFSGRCLERV